MAAQNQGKQLFLGKVACRLLYPLISKIWLKSLYFTQFQRCVFSFYAEIQEVWQKCRVIDLWENSTVNSADTLQVKNFIKIALSRTVSEINAFFFDFWEKLSRLCKFSGGQKFRFTQKFKMADKNVCVCRGGGGQFWGKVTTRFSKYPVGQKFCRNRSILHRFSDSRVFIFTVRKLWRLVVRHFELDHF